MKETESMFPGIAAYPVLSKHPDRTCWGCLAVCIDNDICHTDLPGCSCDQGFNDPTDMEYADKIYDSVRGKLSEVVFHRFK